MYILYRYILCILLDVWILNIIKTQKYISIEILIIYIYTVPSYYFVDEMIEKYKRLVVILL